LEVVLDLTGNGVGNGAPHLGHLLAIVLLLVALAFVGQLHHAHHTICSPHPIRHTNTITGTLLPETKGGYHE
jgi:hypothetical protein